MLKFVMTALIVATAAPAFASATASASDACGKILQCGTYEVSGEADGGVKTSVIIKISSSGPHSGSLKFTRTVGENSKSWPIELTFNSDNKAVRTYIGKIDGKAYAAGFCSDRRICTFALTPMQNTEDTDYGIAGVIIFRGETLEYVKMGAGPGDSVTSTTVLTKK